MPALSLPVSDSLGDEIHPELVTALPRRAAVGHRDRLACGSSITRREGRMEESDRAVGPRPATRLVAYIDAKD
jgi:hypothetical protein